MQIFVINLPDAVNRRKLQKDQLTKLGLEYKILIATSFEDISEATYKKHYFDWQRPLRKTEVACYFSHRSAWKRVIKNNKPALILEDDAILSKTLPELLDSLNMIQNTDLINLENRSRKKFVSKSYTDIACGSKLLTLYQDRTGAAGYILWPTGAKKLIQLEKNSGIGLADAHITACHALKAYQVEPSPIIQLDQCKDYGISNTYTHIASKSTVSTPDNYRGGAYFILKRLLYQLKLALRQLFILTKSQRRYISIRNSDFNV
ncbi:glycosyltransferase family 25 protein [Candidatus Thioglobus sp.]|nr:glycosyltransferase family 25 protein [Candidatus Thioglobus sp.]